VIAPLLGVAAKPAIFARLMRLGVIPEAVCRECNDIRSRSQIAARGA